MPNSVLLFAILLLSAGALAATPAIRADVPEPPVPPLTAPLVAAAPLQPSSDAVCARDDVLCAAAVSWNGTARCEKATCVAVSVWGTAQAGCYGEQCLDDCSGSTQCGVTPCEGAWAVTCAAVAVSPFGYAEAYPYCHWFTQTCFGVAATHHGATVIYCYGDLYDRWNCGTL